MDDAFGPSLDGVLAKAQAGENTSCIDSSGTLVGPVGIQEGGRVYLAKFDTYLCGVLVQAFTRIGYTVIGPLTPLNDEAKEKVELPDCTPLTEGEPCRSPSSQGIAREGTRPSQDQSQSPSDNLRHLGPLDADVVVMLLHQHEAEAKALARELSRTPGCRKRTFVAVSSLLSWARTPSDKWVDGGGGLTVVDEAHRKPHPRAMQLVEAERYIVRCNTPGVLRTAVVWGGVPFGLGESFFLPLFQGAFGESRKVPCYGKGSNRVPTIHVADLATYIAGVAVCEPEGQLFFAVDLANAPLRTLCEAVAKEVEGAEVVSADADDILQRGGDWPLLLLNLPLQPTPLPAPFANLWSFQLGMAASMAKVMAEYREARVRPPVRILIHGPPASGKTTLAALLAETYNITHVTTKAVLTFTASQGVDEELKQMARTALIESPPTSAPTRGRAPPPRPRLSDEVLARMWQQYLLSEKRFAEEGFIMDGFPKTLSQANTLFYQPRAVPPPPQPVLKPSATIMDRSRGPSAANTRPNSKGSNEGKLEGVNPEPPKVEERLLVQWAIYLESKDPLLTARVAAIPPEHSAGTHNTPSEFARRMKAFRALQPQQPALSDLLTQLGATLIPLDIGDEQPVASRRATQQEEAEEDEDLAPPEPQPPLLGHLAAMLVANLMATIGPPERYASYVAPLPDDGSRGSTPETTQDVVETEDWVAREAEEQQLAALAEAQEQLKAQQARWQEEENTKLMEMSQPLYDWLMSAVMPSVVDAMLTVSKAQPKNAARALSRFLRKKAKELEVLALKEEQEKEEAMRRVEEIGEVGEEMEPVGGEDQTEDMDTQVKAEDQLDNADVSSQPPSMVASTRTSTDVNT